MSASVFAVKASSLSRYNSFEVVEGSFTSGLFMNSVELRPQHYTEHGEMCRIVERHTKAAQMHEDEMR